MLLLGVVYLTACVFINSASGSKPSTTQLATVSNWQKLHLVTPPFTLTAYVPANNQHSGTLTVYIEGDGLAWLNRTMPSDDPTPVNSLVFQLALKDPSPAKVYLARPCQYLDASELSQCSQAYWTNRRFSPEVISASDNAIEQLKQRAHSDYVKLIGYSGGGGIAALVAARRHDVAQLVTIAGNLDTTAWTTQHTLQALDGSLNPADFTQTLVEIPQLHLVGGKDTNITPNLVEGFVRRFPAGQQPRMLIIPTFNHSCCWAEQWPALLEQ